MKSGIETTKKRRVNFLHLTDLDLEYQSRKKPFEQISFLDFNYNITDFFHASFVFFVDERDKRKWYNKILGLNQEIGVKVKQLKP